MQTLRVSDNGRFLATEDGKPFFYLGDTAWEIFHRLNHAEMDLYLRNRAAKGFTAIQAVLLAEINGLTEPNALGELAVFDQDPARPNDKYFAHVDEVVRTAESLGLCMAMLPTWGSWVVKQDFHPLFPPIQAFNEANAYTYGHYLGKRYAKWDNIIWVMGGDRPATDYEHVFEAMVKGIRESTGNKHLFTYHPGGPSSSTYWHKSDWLDFNMFQSGHTRRAHRNWQQIAKDYSLSPARPVLDGEPCYEEHPVGFNIANGTFTDHDVRQAAYWSVFAGGCGVTYGCNAIWQMYDQNRKAINCPVRTWKESLNLPGSSQMVHLRRLIESRPFFTRIPDQSIIQRDIGFDTDHMHATRDGTPGHKDATWLAVYTPICRSPKIDSSVLPSDTIRYWWYDPRTGTPYPGGERPNEGTFSPLWHSLPWHLPQSGTDWVLVVDDATAGYPAPGTGTME